MAEGSTVAWFHCFSGLSADMAVGALVDAGADLDEVRALCDRLPLDGWEMDAEPVLRSGLAATRVSVRYENTSVVRTAAHISALIDEARLPDRVRSRAHDAFRSLAVAEGYVHRRPAEKVLFHEVASLGAVISVVGTCAALEILGVDEVYSSAVAFGQGMVRTPNGMMPVPAPAAVELLKAAPTYGLDIAAQLTTPSGAALLGSLVSGWGAMPGMAIEASGFGAGPNEFDDRPNLVQVVLGSASAEMPSGQPITLLEINLDDATGETLAHAVAAVLDAGAHDAWVTPIVMNRGHPAHTVSALVDSALASQVADALVAETGSQGIRGQRLERWPAAHEMDEVDIDGRRVRVKVSAGRVKVEHDDAARAARHIGIPVREVVSLAEEAWRRRERGELTEVRPLNPLEPVPDASSGDDPDIA